MRLLTNNSTTSLIVCVHWKTVRYLDGPGIAKKVGIKGEFTGRDD